MATSRSNTRNKKITRCVVRMYRPGTGDFFVLKFFAGRQLTFKMMIDAGVWQGSKDVLSEYVEDLINYTDGHIDLLVVTHEHRDHVLLFNRCEELFTENITIDKLWLAWTENDGDTEVEKWKKEHGEKKIALSLASDKLNELIKDNSIQKSFGDDFYADQMFRARKNFTEVLNGFAELHATKEEKKYKGGLKGMEVVKKKLNVNEVRYCNQGDIIEELEGAFGIKFYILGPPSVYEAVHLESGDKEESYQHNKELDESDLFAASMFKENNDNLDDNLIPFDRGYLAATKSTEIDAVYRQESWRMIDYDWLMSAGSLALRMNSLTNNLSLAMAIEFEASGRVMLFPGDAEFGSWKSWHTIPWTGKGRDEDKHLTEDLLNRTVFYKVAHHLSHNGTAKSIGLEMMNHKNLVSMASLDYKKISNGWKSTMPNRAIINELLKRTKGRLILMNDEDIFYDFDDQIKLEDKILEAREKMTSSEKRNFSRSFKKHKPASADNKVLYYDYSVKS
jgi:hypothetical protein